MSTVASIPVTCPAVREVVRPYFCTPSPKVAACTTEFGTPYPPGGVQLSSLVTSDTTMAASIVLLGQLPSQNAMVSKANSVPMTVLPVDEQFVSYSPG